jgi:hypothetical protein
VPEQTRDICIKNGSKRIQTEEEEEEEEKRKERGR